LISYRRYLIVALYVATLPATETFCYSRAIRLSVITWTPQSFCRLHLLSSTAILGRLSHRLTKTVRTNTAILKASFAIVLAGAGATHLATVALITGSDRNEITCNSLAFIV
jgi:hypothetical protein